MEYMIQFQPTGTGLPRWEYRITLPSDSMARDYALRMTSVDPLAPHGTFILWRMDRPDGNGSPVAEYRPERTVRVHETRLDEPL